MCFRNVDQLIDYLINCSSLKSDRDHFTAAALALLSVSTMLSLCVYLGLSNTKASRVMKLCTHIGHYAPCLLP